VPDGSFRGTIPTMRPVIFLVGALALAGCASSSSTSMSPTPSASSSVDDSSSPMPPSESAASSVSAQANQADATVLANKIKQTTTTQIVTITEDNDPNELIGRPNGYVSAAVIYDSALQCTALSASCGGVVEVFANPDAAQDRMNYIQQQLKTSPVLGTEFDTIVDSALLRVSGKMKPSVAAAYASVFKG
jgi:hypothetical protein